MTAPVCSRWRLSSNLTRLESTADPMKTGLDTQLCDSDVVQQHENHIARPAERVSMQRRPVLAVKSPRWLLASREQRGAT